MYIQPLLYLLCTVFLGLILTNQYGVAKGIALIISLHFSTYYSKGIFTPITICRVVGVGKVTQFKRLRLHFGDIRVKVTPLTFSRSLALSSCLSFYISVVSFPGFTLEGRNPERQWISSTQPQAKNYVCLLQRR